MLTHATRRNFFLPLSCENFEVFGGLKDSINAENKHDVVELKPGRRRSFNLTRTKYHEWFINDSLLLIETELERSLSSNLKHFVKEKKDFDEFIIVKFKQIINELSVIDIFRTADSLTQ